MDLVIRSREIYMRRKTSFKSSNTQMLLSDELETIEIQISHL